MGKNVNAISASPSRVEAGFLQLDRVLHASAAFVIPTCILLLTLLALVTWNNDYDVEPVGPLPFQILAAAKDGTATIAPVFDSSPPRMEFQTHSAKPFWISFTIPTDSSGPLVAEIHERHITSISCWEVQAQTLVGSVNGNQSQGMLARAAAGLVIAPGALSTPLHLQCLVTFTGPADLRLNRWTQSGFETAVRHFHRSSGILDGGLGVLALFMVVTAIVNRKTLFVIFAAWLIANLRMGAISAGWDVYWIGNTVPWDWLIPLRMGTAASYYVLTIALFGSLFREDLKKIGWTWLWRATQLSCLVVVIACATLTFQHWLPVLWIFSAYTVGVILFFIARILVITPSRVAGWYGISLGITVAATLNEILAAALGLRGLIGHVNSVTAAVFSSLIAALALAEQIRHEHNALLAAQAELNNAYVRSPIGLFTLDETGAFIRSNLAMGMIVEAPDIDHRKWVDFFGEAGWRRILDQVARGEPEIELKTGSRWMMVRAHAAGDQIEGSLHDITERVAASAHMKFLANHDPLTGVLNRRGIEHILETVDRGVGRQLSLGYLDLDRFKLLNDLYGHRTGDRILTQVCDRVTALLQTGEFLGRVGGDEFVILFADTDHEIAGRRCRDIVAAISTVPYEMEERAAQVRCSIGLLHITDDIPLEDAISLADRACREAKNSHSESLVIYRSGSAALHERADELRMMQLFNTNAVPDGLFLVMQPIMSLTAPDQSMDFEVLLRMREADGQITSALPVITAAEASGKIAVVDRWVLSTVLEWIAKHEDHLQRTRFICVNLSGGSLNDENFVRDIYALLASSGDAAHKLCLEITESVALQDLQVTRRFIEQIRQYGVKIALDDFGAGYTSFSYLRELPADAVKIDGAFIRGMMGHPANLAIVTAIIDLAHNLGMKTIAEWVEDVATLEGLVAAGADYAQGYIIARPCEPEKLLLCDSASDLIEDPATVEYVSKVLCVYPEGDDTNVASVRGLLLH